MIPTVSVVIPTYNRANLLRRAIQSVLNQTYQNFEIIVVDDGSSDNTEEVVGAFNDRKIVYIRHKKRLGEAAARNSGIRVAKGKYIASQDSDDEWFPERLEKQMKIFEKVPSKIGVVYTGFWWIRNGQQIYIPSPEVKQKEGDIHSSLLEGNFIGTPTTLVRKECFEKSGTFDERLPHFVDWELWIRVSKYYHFKYLDEPLVKSYYTSGSISSDSKALVTAMELILEKHFDDIKKNRKLLARHSYDIGKMLCQQGQMNRGISYLLQAIRAYPLNIKFPLAVLISLFGPEIYRIALKLKRLIMCRLRKNR